MIMLSNIKNNSFCLVFAIVALSSCLRADISFEEKTRIISKKIQLFSRPITFLETYAHSGELALTLAKSHQGVFVLNGISSELKQRAESQLALDNVVLLDACTTPHQIEHLASCEHFDVVFAHNFPLQTFPEKKALRYLKALCDLGETIFLEIHLSEELLSQQKSIKRFLHEEEATFLYSDEQSILLLIEKKKLFNRRTTWLQSESPHNSVRQIISDYHEKKMVKDYKQPNTKIVKSQWIPGINMITFKMCHGIYPKNDSLKKDLLLLSKVPHKDWIINNTVLSLGNRVDLIDFEDPYLNERYRAVITDEYLRLHMEFLDLLDENDLRKKFDEICRCAAKEVRKMYSE